MIEYQYYDFRAVDQSLTAEQKASVASLSSRAQVSSQRAEFVYHYGDFRGNVIQLMRDTFDIMLYIANWGTRLMFRLPKALFNVSEVRDYFISAEIIKPFVAQHPRVYDDLQTAIRHDLAKASSVSPTLRIFKKCKIFQWVMNIA